MTRQHKAAHKILNKIKKYTTFTSFQMNEVRKVTKICPSSFHLSVAEVHTMLNQHSRPRGNVAWLGFARHSASAKLLPQQGWSAGTHSITLPKQ